jgi:hypothetical protein
MKDDDVIVGDCREGHSAASVRDSPRKKEARAEQGLQYGTVYLLLEHELREQKKEAVLFDTTRAIRLLQNGLHGCTVTNTPD